VRDMMLQCSKRASQPSASHIPSNGCPTTARPTQPKTPAIFAARVSREVCPDLRVLVAAVVVEHDMDQLAGRDVASRRLRKRINSWCRWRCMAREARLGKLCSGGITTVPPEMRRRKRGFFGNPRFCIDYLLTRSARCLSMPREARLGGAPVGLSGTRGPTFRVPSAFGISRISSPRPPGSPPTRVPRLPPS
jgi:hypothetical protein